MFSTFRTTAISAAALAVAQFASPAQAAYTVTLEQVGANVVATGSGTLNIAGLGSIGPGIDPAGLVPFTGVIITGPPAVGEDFYTGVTGGPTSFGSGPVTLASSGSGDKVDIGGQLRELTVPLGYVSGNPLADTSTYDNTSFSSLGVTPGTYTWTLPSGDTFRLQIGVVPEPASLTLLAVGLAGLGIALRTRRA
jgi:hypothetical protein